VLLVSNRLAITPSQNIATGSSQRAFEIEHLGAARRLRYLSLGELVSVAGEGSKEVHDLLERAAGEARQGGNFNMHLVSVVGRKAGGV
jgi:hypothetical protein